MVSLQFRTEFQNIFCLFFCCECFGSDSRARFAYLALNPNDNVIKFCWVSGYLCEVLLWLWSRGGMALFYLCSFWPTLQSWLWIWLRDPQPKAGSSWRQHTGQWKQDNSRGDTIKILPKITDLLLIAPQACWECFASSIPPVKEDKGCISLTKMIAGNHHYKHAKRALPSNWDF